MRPKILVVEDNPDNRKLFAWMLEDHGFEFTAAVTAEEGLLELERDSYFVVLMDISLPGMDGKEATRRIRSDPRFARLPVIAVTAHAVKGEDEQILSAGVSALVTKPIDEYQLIHTIRSFLPLGATHGQSVGC